MKTKLSILTVLAVVMSLCLVPAATLAQAPSAGVDLQVNVVPAIVAISVTPTSIDFGDVVVGQNSKVEVITVNNTGTVPFKVHAYLVPAIGSVFDCLKLNGEYPTGSGGDWTSIMLGLVNIPPGNTESVNAQLVVPANWTELGLVEIGLEFLAEPARQEEQ